jgi:hypothetical protein
MWGSSVLPMKVAYDHSFSYIISPGQTLVDKCHQTSYTGVSIIFFLDANNQSELTAKACHNMT